MARTERKKGKGVSLAKGPVAIVAIILIAAAVIALIAGATQFTTHPVSGDVNGKKIAGFELNGWSMLLTGVAGLVLLFGARFHWTAKSLSLIVGLVLGAASVIALVDGTDVFGIFAANGLTKLGWGLASAVLIVLSLLPRVGGRKRHDDDDDVDAGRRRDRDRDLERERGASDAGAVAEGDRAPGRGSRGGDDDLPPGRRRLRDRV
jgi:hypothetical protein